MDWASRFFRAAMLLAWAMTVPTAAAVVWAGVAVWHVLIAACWIVVGLAHAVLYVLSTPTTADQIRQLRRETDALDQDVTRTVQELDVFVSDDSLHVHRRATRKTRRKASQSVQEPRKRPTGPTSQGAVRGGSPVLQSSSPGPSDAG